MTAERAGMQETKMPKALNHDGGAEMPAALDSGGDVEMSAALNPDGDAEMPKASDSDGDDDRVLLKADHAVSYTHLDGYKRQGTFIAMRSPVTTALMSPTVEGFFVIFSNAHSKKTADITHTSVSIRALKPKI